MPRPTKGRTPIDFVSAKKTKSRDGQPPTPPTVSSRANWVDYHARKYQDDRNPLHVWEAYLEARAAGVQLPPFVVEYFDRVARRFANMSRQHSTAGYSGPERRRSNQVTPRTADLGPERRRAVMLDFYRQRDPGDPVLFTIPTAGKVASLKGKGTICPYVFQRRGKRVRSLRKAWANACTEAGYPGRILHDLRRSAVRNMERRGLSRSVAMQLTGHKTESVYRRYAITSEADLREGVERLNASAGAGELDRRKSG